MVLAMAHHPVLPSAKVDGVGAPIDVISRLNGRACVCPCQRFDFALAGKRA
jgi:hypothetical protein